MPRAWPMRPSYRLNEELRATAESEFERLRRKGKLGRREWDLMSGISVWLEGQERPDIDEYLESVKNIMGD